MVSDVYYSPLLSFVKRGGIIKKDNEFEDYSLEHHLAIFSKADCRLERKIILEHRHLSKKITGTVLLEEIKKIYEKRYILSFLRVSALQRYVWGQEYKYRFMKGEYVPKFLVM